MYTRSDLLAARTTLAKAKDLGIPGTLALGRADASNIAVVSGLNFENELNCLAPMRLLMERASEWLADDWAIILLIVRPTEGVPQEFQPNRVPFRPFNADNLQFARAIEVSNAMGKIATRVVLDVSDGPADGLVIDVMEGAADLHRVASAIPAAKRISGLPEQQRKTGYVPLGTIYRPGTTVVEVLTQEHTGNLGAAINSVFSPLIELGALKLPHEEVTGAQLLYTAVESMVAQPHLRYTFTSQSCQSWTRVKTGDVIGGDSQGNPVKAPADGCLWGFHQNVGAGGIDPLGYLLQIEGGTKTHVMVPQL